MSTVEYYTTPGTLTDLSLYTPALAGLQDGPDDLQTVVRGLLVHRDAPELAGVELPPHRYDETQRRGAAATLERILQLGPTPLSEPRDVQDRMVGVCYHAAVLLCALLRSSGTPGRARCGFAGYFEAGLWLDHWITEWWDGNRWVADDPDVGRSDIARGVGNGDADRFLTGGEAWSWCRAGGADPSTFGVAGHTFGLAEISGNAVRDLAALNKLELLPWDNWGLMEACYDGDTGDDYDVQIDLLAAATTSDDLLAIQDIYDRVDHFQVPATLL